MSIKKLLLCVAAMAIAMTAFASSAMAATDGVIKDSDGTIIPANKELKARGWASFTSLSGGIECHVTATIKATGALGTTGQVTAFAPATTTCKGVGAFEGCKVTADTVNNLPYAVTVTPTDLDVTGTIAINSTLSNCNTTSIVGVNLAFTAITLKVIKTGTNPITNTESKLGATGTTNDLIAGVEISGNGTAEILNAGTKLPVEAKGELEIEGTNRCTYKIT
jgi:hypothetical protein